SQTIQFFYVFGTFSNILRYRENFLFMKGLKTLGTTYFSVGLLVYGFLVTAIASGDRFKLNQ
ncbi:MAG: hypothetical protein ACK559_36045, partial [bacterium]